MHAGHLFHVSINPNRVMLTDLKFGQQNLKIRPAYQKKTLSEEQKALLASKTKRFGNKLELGKWHEVRATIQDDEIRCSINGKEVGASNPKALRIHARANCACTSPSHCT